MTPTRLLVVEDESIVALDLKARLNRLGYSVIGTAASGEEAIKLAEDGRPQLVLMDIRLRGDMDGIETAQILRARYNIPVIYLTAHADDATLQRAKTTEPFGYLTKPFEERELHSTLDMALYRMELDRQMQRQSAQLERIVFAIPEGVALLDADFRLEIANPQAQDFLQILSSVAVGDIVEHLGTYPLAHLLHAEEDPHWCEIVVGTADPRIFEVIVMQVSAKQERISPQEALSSYLLVIREVTAERELQQRVQLQDRLAAIGQFSAGIAHDFNNIVSSITLSSQVIRMMEPNLSPKVTDRLESIVREAARASDLIKQILDFSRASSVELQPMDLTPRLKDYVKMLERMLPESIRLELSLPTGPCWIVGDPTGILQVLMNLVLNARDALPLGGVLLLDVAQISGEKLDFASRQPQDEWVQINIADNGTGILPDVLPHIFEPFFTTKGPGSGTGLGLAQVYGIVQQHKGYIRVDSKWGQGSTFSVYLPALHPSASLGTHPPAEETDLVHGGMQTILIAEDNLVARQSMTEILDLLNYHVLTAANGREALTILEQPENRVDLLLSDLVMPEMGGMELLRELKQRKIDVKTIVMTGYSSDETRTGLRELPISGFLNKPIDVASLSQCIEQALLN